MINTEHINQKRNIVQLVFHGTFYTPTIAKCTVTCLTITEHLLFHITSETYQTQQYINRCLTYCFNYHCTLTLFNRGTYPFYSAPLVYQLQSQRLQAVLQYSRSACKRLGIMLMTGPLLVTPLERLRYIRSCSRIAHLSRKSGAERAPDHSVLVIEMRHYVEFYVRSTTITHEPESTNHLANDATRKSEHAQSHTCL